MRFCQRSLYNRTVALTASSALRRSFTCIHEPHARTALTHSYGWRVIRLRITWCHMMRARCLGMKAAEGAGPLGSATARDSRAGKKMRWRQQKSFEEVDAYLQGHIPPSRSKRLEDVFDGETTLLFQSAVARRRGSPGEGRRGNSNTAACHLIGGLFGPPGDVGGGVFCGWGTAGRSSESIFCPALRFRH